MNSITDLLDLEDSDVIVSDISIECQTKTIALESTPNYQVLPFVRIQDVFKGCQKENH